MRARRGGVVWLLAFMLQVVAVASAAPASAADPVRIATSLPMTGNSAWYGAQGRNGAELAVAEVNAAGGVLGRSLALDIWDNRCNPAEGVRSVTQALSEKRYAAVHEGGCSSVALAVMPLVERAGIPFVVGSPSATSISERSGVGGNIWTFKVIPTDAGMLSALVGWIADKGQADRIVFLGEDTDYGRGGASALEAALQANGKSLASKNFYQQGTSDFSTLIARVQAGHPSLVAAYTIGADGQNFLRQWVEAGGGAGLTGRIFTDQIPAEILQSGVLNGLTTVHPYDLNVDDPANKAFVASHQKAYNALPTPPELGFLRGREDHRRCGPRGGDRRSGKGAGGAGTHRVPLDVRRPDPLRRPQPGPPARADPGHPGRPRDRAG